MDACFVVRDYAGQKLAYVYFKDGPGDARQLLTKDENEGGAMALADMNWTQINIHHVVLQFLRCEGRTTKFPTPPEWQAVIDNPNLNDPLENQKRLRLLYIPRAKFMIEVPPDTTWWEVHSLTENEIGELHVSAKHNREWDQPGNQLQRVAASVPIIPLTAPPSAWPGRIILWAHERKGPFTILEGNHRLLAYTQATSGAPLQLDVYVGLPPSYCF